MQQIENVPTLAYWCVTDQGLDFMVREETLDEVGLERLYYSEIMQQLNVGFHELVFGEAQRRDEPVI